MVNRTVWNPKGWKSGSKVMEYAANGRIPFSRRCALYRTCSGLWSSNKAWQLLNSFCFENWLIQRLCKVWLLPFFQEMKRRLKEQANFNCDRSFAIILLVWEFSHLIGTKKEISNPPFIAKILSLHPHVHRNLPFLCLSCPHSPPPSPHRLRDQACCQSSYPNCQ